MASKKNPVCPEWRSKDGHKIPAITETAARQDFNEGLLHSAAEEHADGDVERLEKKVVPTNSIDVSEFEESPSTMKLYEKMAESEGTLPPIVVRWTGNSYHVIDGHHRLAAARKHKLPEMLIIQLKGSGLTADDMHKSEKWTPHGLYHELIPVAHLESEFGSTQTHAPHPMGELLTPMGAVGMKPTVAYDEYLRSKKLQELFPGLHDTESFLAKLKEDHELYNLVASSLFARLKARHGSTDKAVYAWRWGDGAASNADEATVANDEYVQQYKQKAADAGMMKSEGLAKTKPTPVFPKLGLGDNRRETPYVSTPSEVASKIATVALSDTKHPKNVEQFEPNKLKTAMRNVAFKNWASAEQGSPRAKGAVADAPTGVHSGYVLAGDYAPMSTGQSGTLGTKLHEDWHMMMNRVHEKHGEQGRRNLAANLLNAIPVQYKGAVDRFFDHKAGGLYRPENEPEEKLASLLNYVNSPNDRLNFHDHRKQMADPNFDSQQHDLHMRRAYSAIRAAAETADESWVKNKKTFKSELQTETGDTSFNFGANVKEDPFEQGRQVISRMRDPNKKKQATDFLAYASGQLDKRPEIHPDLERHLARFGVVDPQGYSFDQFGRDMAKPISGKRGQYEKEPEELKRLRMLNLGLDRGSALGKAEVPAPPSWLPKEIAHNWELAHQKYGPEYMAHAKEDASPDEQDAINRSVKIAHWPSLDEIQKDKAIHIPTDMAEEIVDPENKYPDSWKMALAENKNTDSNILTKLSNDKEQYVRQSAARHPKATNEHLMAALKDKSPYVRAAVMSNPNATPEHIAEALQDKHAPVRESAAKHPNITEELIHTALDDKNEYIRQAAVQNPKANDDHITRALVDKEFNVRRAAILNPNATADHIRDGLVDRDRDVVEAAKNHPKYVEDPDFFHDESVEFAHGTNKLRKLRDHIDTQGGSVNKNKIPNYPKELNHLLDAKGNLTSKKIQEHIDSLPKSKYNIAHTDWDGAQRHSKDDSNVLQVQATTDHVNKMKEAGVWDTFKKLNATAQSSSHPSTPHTLGWVRHTGDQNGIQVDEVQSDFSSDLGKAARAQAAAAGISEDEAQAHADSEYPPEHVNKIREILFGNKHPSAVLHEAFRQHLRNKGWHETPVHVHDTETKMPLAQQKLNQPAPVHMKIGYNEVPKKMGMEPGEYGELPTQSNPDLKGAKQWKDTVRKTEELEKALPKTAKPKTYTSKDGIKYASAGTPERKTQDKAHAEAVAKYFAGNNPKRLKKIKIPVDLPTGSNMAVNKDRLSLYTKMAKDKQPLPHVVVRRNGLGYDLLDGNHRQAAAKAAGLTHMDAYEILPDKD